MAAISGVIKSFTNAVTTAANATPTTTATARSTTFPRRMNFLKSVSIDASQHVFLGAPSWDAYPDDSRPTYTPGVPWMSAETVNQFNYGFPGHHRDP